MSKYLFFTDTHIGARQGSKVFREYFREYYRDVFFPYVKEHGITELIHLGDFFDNRTSLSTVDIDYIVNEWLPLLEDSGATMRVIVGNHDCHYKNTNRINSLSVLQHSEYVKVIQDELEVVETQGKRFVLCPWLSPENKDELIEELQFYKDKNTILCGHFEFEGSKMYANSIACENGLKPKNFKGFDSVWSGHFHHPSRNGNIEYLGALCHYNWSDWNDWRGFRVYDDETDEIEKIENDYCLFNVLTYEELKDLTDKELKGECEDRFVLLYIFDEYDKVDMKDFHARVQRCGPLSFDVIDKTIIDSLSESNDTEETDIESKELIDYAEDKLRDHEQKDDLLQIFQSIYTKAIEQRKDIE